MKLLVIRHAIPENESPSGRDEDRPLSSKGREEFNRTCQFMAQGLSFDLLLNSPLLRACQTADIFCQYFSVKKRGTHTGLSPLAEPSALFLKLKAERGSSSVIIGHQPFLTQFISRSLKVGTEGDFISLKRGGMVFLEFPLIVQAGSAICHALWNPELFLPFI